MAQIAVVTSSPPFSEGGHLVIARALVMGLKEAGHRADLILTPQNSFGRQAAAYIATRLTDMSRSADNLPTDQIISLRFPSYAARHPVHVCWLNHTMREYYDLWETFASRLSSANRVKESVRRAILHRVDRYLLIHNVRKLFVQSKTIQDRLLRWGNIPSEVLYPPAPQRPYRCDAYEPYVFAVSRLAPLKRLELLVEAFAIDSSLPLRGIIAGEGEEYAHLGQLISDRGLGERVVLLGRVSDDQLVEHFARCRAVFFAPLDEDYGLVTLEAFRSRKPVVTCRDSGGPTELVSHGRTGFVCDPTPNAIAEALNHLSDPALSEQLGEAAHQESLKYSWPDTIRKLVIV